MHSVITRLLITEKNMGDMEQGKYTFVVAHGVNRSEIKKATRQISDVVVGRVNTMDTHGRTKRRGVSQGRKPAWKKAVTKLTENSNSIEFFEGMQ